MALRRQAVNRGRCLGAPSGEGCALLGSTGRQIPVLPRTCTAVRGTLADRRAGPGVHARRCVVEWDEPAVLTEEATKAQIASSHGTT